VASTLVKSVTDSNFEQEVLLSALPTLVDFWAEWCRPCQQLGPVLDEIASDFSDKIVVAKINVDNSPSVTAKYNIRGIPALLLFREGKLLGQTSGFMPKAKLLTFLDEYLNFIGVGQ